MGDRSRFACSRIAALLAAAVLLVPPPAGAQQPAVNCLGVQYVPPDQSAFVPAATIDTWVRNFDDAAIRGHAFALWGALTARSGQFYAVRDKSGKEIRTELAVFDTWFDEFETFHTQPFLPSGTPSCVKNGGAGLRLHGPRQTSEGAGGAEVVSFNKYTKEFVDYVNQNNYFGEQTLIDLNNQFIRNNTPLEQRFTQPVAGNALMLKPSYFIVKADKPSPMQYWRGPGLTIAGTGYARVPTTATWEQIVVVDPTGTARPGTPYTIQVVTHDGTKPMTFTDYQIVGLDRFYWFPLSAQDIDYIRGGNVFTVNGVLPSELEPGDLALLVAMHVTSNENRPWTWQTFFWRPEPVADVGPTVKPPFNNYDTATAYYMVKQDGSPHVAFNPYLEPPIIGPIYLDPTMTGATSNCMSCHHAAAYPTLNNDPSLANMLLGSYWANGTVTGTEQWFQGRVKTHFMWGLIMQNQCLGVALSASSVFRCTPAQP
jgi:hypothetical protein